MYGRNVIIPKITGHDHGYQEGSHVTLDLGAIHDALGHEAKSWAKMKSKLDAGEISKKEYDNWRYNYPANTHGYHKLIDL